MRTPGFAPLDQNAVIVRITAYHHRNPQGTLASPRLEKPAPFASLVQLFSIMEALMDQSNQPQRGEERRGFAKAAPLQNEPMLPDLGDERQRELATFQLRVLFRQNASWQGTLIWVDKKMEAQFRSVLEMVQLMDSALSAEEVV